MKKPSTQSARPVGASDTKSDNQVATGNISQRLERIRSWHNISRDQAWKLKLIVFFAGMEIQALKAELGITAGNPEKVKSETVSELTNGKCRTWDELVELHCGMTQRTALNYVTAYENICREAPGFVEAVLKVAEPRITGVKQPLALPDPNAAIAKIPEEELEKFREAMDPWSLRELYIRPMKPAQAQIVEELEKAKAAKRDVQTYLKFWFDELDTNIKNRSYLRLPKPQREMLLNTLEITIKELRDSLRVRK